MKDPIFIVGSGRSGTTILGRTVGLHPHIYGLKDESRFLVARHGALLDWAFEPTNETVAQAFRQRIRGGFVGREAMRDLFEFPSLAKPLSRWRRLAHGSFYNRPLPHTPYDVGLCRDVELGHFKRVVSAFLADFPQPSLEERLVSVSNFCADLLSPSLARKGAMRWCDDTPRSALYLRELARVFPNLRVVHMIRDGRDVARSFQRLGWIPTRRAALHMWFQHLSIARRTGTELGTERYLELRFEDLTQTPDQVLRTVIDFLGEPWTPEMESHRIKPDVAARRQREPDPELDATFRAMASDLIDEFQWPR